MVKHFGVQIDNSSVIKDGSLLYRNGLRYDPGARTTDQDADFASEYSQLNSYLPEVNIETDDLDVIRRAINPEKILERYGTFPVESLVEDGAADQYRYAHGPIAARPSFVDDTTTQDQIRYIRSYADKSDDQVRAEKRYSDLNGGLLELGDIVKVTVTLKGNGAMSYIDEIT